LAGGFILLSQWIPNALYESLNTIPDRVWKPRGPMRTAVSKTRSSYSFAVRFTRHWSTASLLSLSQPLRGWVGPSIEVPQASSFLRETGFRVHGTNRVP